MTVSTSNIGGLSWSPQGLFNHDFISTMSWNWFTGGTVLATVVGSLFFFIGNRKKRRELLGPYIDDLSIHIGNGVYKSGLLKNDKQNVLDTVFPEVKTLYQTFLRGMKVSANGQCLGKRVGNKYEFLTYEEVFQQSHAFGSALIAKLGLQPGNDTNVAIYARNSQEWFISTMSCVQYSMVIVPLYDTLGTDAATYILKHTESSVVIVDDDKKAKKLLESSNIDQLKHVVVIDEISNETFEALLSINLNVEIHRFRELVAIGATVLKERVEPKPDDSYIICYTSGTTGMPKGVVLTHANIVANFSGVLFFVQKFLPDIVKPYNTCISYLPLSHMFEQDSHWTMLAFGGSIGYFSGSITELSADMKALRPTILPIVPRLLNRFNDTMKVEVSRSNFFVRQMFNLAYRQKLSYIKQGIITKKTIWDKLVFKKIQAELGGNVKLIITGSAPISAQVLESCRIAFGACICEGYGQTECTAMATCTLPNQIEGGNCGGPGVCTLLKLEDVPELNYYAKDRKGEILIKGPSVTKGYYKDTEKTAELFDDEGFLHTGDIGQLLLNGALKIIDRKKHIFKLAQGEYVAPEKIENVYVQSLLVQQIFVDGDSLENFLVAIVVPIPKQLSSLYQSIYSTNNSKLTLEEICKDKKVVAYVLKEIQALGKSHKLNSIEQVKAIYLEPEPFTVENKLLTPTLKSKRPQLRQKYTDVIKCLYKSI